MLPEQEDEYICAADRLRYNAFVTEYMIDFNPKLACIRMGYMDEEADQASKAFWNRPYVQQEIARRCMTPKTPDEKKVTATIDEERIKAALMREAHNYGPGSSHAARVNALSRLCSIYGLDAPKTINSNVNHTGNVLMVPEMADLDSWEKKALESQTSLVSNVRH